MPFSSIFETLGSGQNVYPLLSTKQVNYNRNGNKVLRKNKFKGLVVLAKNARANCFKLSKD